MDCELPRRHCVRTGLHRHRMDVEDSNPRAAGGTTPSGVRRKASLHCRGPRNRPWSVPVAPCPRTSLAGPPERAVWTAPLHVHPPLHRYSGALCSKSLSPVRFDRVLSGLNPGTTRTYPNGSCLMGLCWERSHNQETQRRCRRYRYLLHPGPPLPGHSSWGSQPQAHLVPFKRVSIVDLDVRWTGGDDLGDTSEGGYPTPNTYLPSRVPLLGCEAKTRAIVSPDDDGEPLSVGIVAPNVQECRLPVACRRIDRTDNWPFYPLNLSDVALGLTP